MFPSVVSVEVRSDAGETPSTDSRAGGGRAEQNSKRFARHVVCELLRRLERTQTECEWSECDERLRAIRDIGSQLCLREELRRCHALSSSSTPPQRQFCELAYYWGLGAKEIAVYTTSSLRTVNK